MKSVHTEHKKKRCVSFNLMRRIWYSKTEHTRHFQAIERRQVRARARETKFNQCTQFHTRAINLTRERERDTKQAFTIEVSSESEKKKWREEAWIRAMNYIWNGTNRNQNRNRNRQSLKNRNETSIGHHTHACSIQWIWHSTAQHSAAI